jgi:phytoene dehydrogenase-like protein
MKIVVTGSDHNALVCAIELNKAGHKVEVLEGENFSGIASLVPSCPLAPEVASGLDLGVSLEIVGRVGLSSAGQEVSLKLRDISGDVTERDKARWRDFVKVLNNASELWRGLFQQGEPDVVARWREFGPRQSMEVLRLPCQSLSELLDDWFESDLLKATLAVAALRGSRQGPFAPGSAFLLLQRWARGEVFGRARTGGMVLKKLAEEAGVVFCKEHVEQYHLSLGRVDNARTSSGSEVTADLFVTSEDPVYTIEHRVGKGKVDPELVAASEFWDCRSTTTVAKLAPSDRWNGAVVSIANDLESLERAYDPTKYGKFSESPFVELDSRAGWLYAQHLDGDEAAAKVDSICQAFELGEVKRLYTPAELSQEHPATGGHLFGGEKSLWQSYGLRQRFCNPVSNLYLCGASTGPGDYSGVSGLMCARLVGSLAAV